MKTSTSNSTWCRGGILATMCAVLACVLVTSVHGHYGRAGHSLMFPRRAYSYHRRTPSIDLMGEMLSLPVYFNSLFRQQQEELSHRAQSDPAYRVQELASGDIELTMDVPGVAAADLNVELLEDGTLLRVSGSRRYHTYVTKFDQLFRLDKEVDGDNLTVRLSDGVLRVNAPKKEKVVKKLPIIVEDEKDADIVDVDAKVVSDTSSNNEESEEVDGMAVTTEAAEQ